MNYITVSKNTPITELQHISKEILGHNIISPNNQYQQYTHICTYQIFLEYFSSVFPVPVHMLSSCKKVHSWRFIRELVGEIGVSNFLLGHWTKALDSSWTNSWCFFVKCELSSHNQTTLPPPPPALDNSGISVGIPALHMLCSGFLDTALDQEANF